MNENQLWVLLKCCYDGDSNLMDDLFVACGTLESLLKIPEPGVEVFIDRPVPDDGGYNREPLWRYRIIPVDPLGGAFVAELKPDNIAGAFEGCHRFFAPELIA